MVQEALSEPSPTPPNSSPFAAEAMQSPPRPPPQLPGSFPPRELPPLATATHLTLQVAVFDRGKPAASGASRPFLSIPSATVRATRGTIGNPDACKELSYSLDVASILVSSTPRQLEVLCSHGPPDLPFALHTLQFACHESAHCWLSGGHSGRGGLSV